MNLSTESEERLSEALSLLKAGQAEKAKPILLELQAEYPANKYIGRALGQVLLADENLTEAQEHFASLVEVTDGDPVCVLDYAAVLRRNGERSLAIEWLTRTLKAFSGLTPGWFMLGDVLVEERRFEEANEAYRNAEKNDPFRLQIDQAKRSLNSADMPKARRILVHILEQDPKHVEALSGMAVLAMQVGNHVEAEQHFNAALTRTSYWPTLLMGVSQLFLTTSRAYEAKQTLLTLVEISANSVMAWNMLGAASEQLMQHDDAISAYQQSLDLRPDQPRILVSMGNVYRIVGQRTSSENYYRSALKYPGENGEAYWGLSNLKDYQFSDQELKSMEEELARDRESLHNAAPLFFACAKAFEDRSLYPQAFSFYERGNSIQKQYSGFDLGLYRKEIYQIKQVFDRDFIFDRLARREQEATPIFVVGMPRTGSTLVEQILSCHSRVEATMELPFIGQYVREINEKLAHLGSYPESVRSISRDLFGGFADRYLDSTKGYRSGALFFIDKMPNNFVHIGLIKILFPDAKIIDIRRHPLDTFLSVFKQRFAQGQSYSYDMADISGYYQGYIDLMEHWNRVFPGEIYTLQYERLVLRPEESMEKLLSYLGLEFESACLEPENNRRPIRTASSEQVRKGVHRKNIGYWKFFENELSSVKDSIFSLISVYEHGLRSIGIEL